MSLCASHVNLIERWVALGGVPADRGTRDFVCDELLLKLWADRQALATLSEHLSEQLIQAVEEENRHG